MSHSAGAGSIILIEDIFDVKDVDPEGKKFDRVSRLVCTSENYEMDLVLDINTDVYPVEIGERITVALARTLELDGRQDDGKFDPTLHGLSSSSADDDEPSRPSLMDSYEYVMYGRVFNYKPEHKMKDRVSLYVSFGGLLMKLSGDPHNMNTIFPAHEDAAQQQEADAHLYILIRK